MELNHWSVVNLLVKYQHSKLAVVALLLGAGIWGMIWHPFRILDRAGIGAEYATTITYFFALVLGLTLFRRSLRMSAIFNGEALLLLWIGLFAGVANIAYVIGVVHGEIMRVLLLFYLAPLWTIFFARFLLNERLSIHGFFVIALSLAGAAFILWQPGQNLPLPQSFGDWMGLLGGFMFAFVNVLVRKDQRHNVALKSIAIWLGITLVGLACSLNVSAPLNVAAISPSLWTLLLAVGLMMFVSSVVLQFGLTYTPANQAVVILLFELVVAAIMAYFLANEAMTSREWIGGLMIISAALFSAKVNRLN